MLCMYYEDGFTLEVYSTFELLKYSKIDIYFRPVLNHAFDF